ncbi:type IV pilus assembly protein FimV [Craterilacuibacter sp.]|uniref:type IV pilus assembly protein FimV n=1 Tax=Craterilacuibacter sp. TaxID=2870909 RepID=UPI003F2A6941
MNRSVLTPAILALPLALGVLVAPQAQAGLGPLKILSTQGEALLGEVALDLAAAPYPAQVRLAAASDYPSLQPYTPNAAGLRFELVSISDGQHVVRIFGPALAGTDVLRFAIEFVWPGGRWIREYRLYGYNIPKHAPSLDAGGDRSRPFLPLADALPPARRPVSYRVATGDTAFALVRRFYPRLSQEKATRLLLAANPRAFVAGDANRLLAGAKLVLPDAPSSTRRIASAPARALSEPPPAKEIVQAPVAADAEAVDKARAERSIVQLQQAQARLAALERELARQSLMPLASAGVDVDDTLLDGELARWLAGGAGGVAVMSLLAWQLRRRRHAAGEKSSLEAVAVPVRVPGLMDAAVPADSAMVDAAIAGQHYVDESVALLQIDHQAMSGPPVDSAELALSRLFAEMGDREAADRAAQDSRATF